MCDGLYFISLALEISFLILLILVHVAVNKNNDIFRAYAQRTYLGKLVSEFLFRSLIYFMKFRKRSSDTK